jgi:hypothetical protein
MAKFKVGDRVRILNVPSLSIFERHYALHETTIEEIRSIIGLYKLTNIPYIYSDNELELVEPEKPVYEPSYTQEYWYNINGDFSYLGFLREWSFDTKTLVYKMSFINPKKPVGVNHSTAEFQKNNYKKHLFTTSEKELYEKNAKIKKAFERPMVDEELAKKLRDTVSPLFFKGFGSGKDTPNENDFPYYHFSLDDDALDAIRYVLPPNLDYQRNILGIRTKPEPPKNRIPDRVVFNQDKGKVTVLISKHLDGVAPYWAYTVKTSENDKYDAIFGFMLAYFKYLNRSLEPKEQKALIERVFTLPQTKRFPYLIGVVEQELLKHLRTPKKVEELIMAITSPNADMNYNNVSWDYLEWKEMLRVHELELKREHDKEVRKQIKAHEKEIEKLKKGDKK